MYPSSSSTNEPPTCQYSSNPLSVAAATALARVSYCSNQNLYRASYCPPPTSYTNQYGPPNHYPHTTYQYPIANQHVTTNLYPPTSLAVEANLERIDRAILARYHPQSVKDPLLRRQVEAIAFKYAQQQQALDGANKNTTNQYPPHTYHAPLSNNQTQPPINSRPIDNTNGGAPHLISMRPDIQHHSAPPLATAPAQQTRQKGRLFISSKPLHAATRLPSTKCYPPPAYIIEAEKVEKKFEANVKRLLQQQKKESKKQKMEPEEEIEGRVEKQRCRGGCGEMLGKNHFTKSQWTGQRKCLKCLLPRYIRLLGSVEKAIEYIAQEMGVPRSDLLLLEERMKLEEEERKKLHEKKQQEKKQQKKQQEKKQLQEKKQQEKKEEFVVEEKFKRQQLVALEESLKTDKNEVKSFYSPTITINTKAAITSDLLADRYRSDFNSKSEEEVVLERLASCYDFQKHKKKEGFDEVVVDGLECGIESRYMNWYLRLNGRYGKFPFIGNSDDDYLLQFVKNLTHRTKARITIIQRKRKKHLIAPRSIDDTVLLSAQVFKQLDVNGTEGDPVELAKKGLADLFDILCFDEVDDSQDDPFNLLLDLE